MPKYTFDFPEDIVMAVKTVVPAEDSQGLTDKAIVTLWLNRQVAGVVRAYNRKTDVSEAVATEFAARTTAEAAQAAETVARKVAEGEANVKSARTVVT